MLLKRCKGKWAVVKGMYVVWPPRNPNPNQALDQRQKSAITPNLSSVIREAKWDREMGLHRTPRRKRQPRR